VAVRCSRLAAVLGIWWAMGCSSRDPFETCAMTDKMKADCRTGLTQGTDACSEAEFFCFDTCLVRDHPQCVEGPCMLYEARKAGETAPASSGATPFCTMPCHGTACAGDALCRPVSSLKVPCAQDQDCAGQAPWSRCETARRCAASGVLCEVDGDCGASGGSCVERPDEPRFCTWKLCVPKEYVPGA